MKSDFTVLAVLCLVIGALLVLENFGFIHGVLSLWPVFPLFIGFGGISFYRKRPKKDPKALGVGIFLILTSIFFFALNYTSWSYMAKLWPAFIGIFGITLLITSASLKTKRWIAMSGLLFVFMSAVFFLVFTLNTGLWPISLILFGIWLLVLPRRSSHEKESINS